MATAQEEIRAVIEERVAAVQAKDTAPLAARTDQDVVTFDVISPLNGRGRQTVVDRASEWFASYSTDIGYDVEQLEIHAGDDVAFCSYLYHVTGTLHSGTRVSMWVRATAGLRRAGAVWRIVHEHESVPFDPQTGQSLTDLSPR